MASITEAKTFSVIDELGVDPLRDKSYDAIASIQEFQYYTVKPEEQFNMPLLAYNVYLNEDYWRVIMIYNGIADMFAVKEGLRIKIPALGLVATALNNVLVETNNSDRIVSI